MAILIVCTTTMAKTGPLRYLIKQSRLCIRDRPAPERKVTVFSADVITHSNKRTGPDYYAIFFRPRLLGKCHLILYSATVNLHNYRR